MGNAEGSEGRYLFGAELLLSFPGFAASGLLKIVAVGRLTVYPGSYE